MSTASNLNCLLLTLCVMAAGVLPGGTACPVLAQTAETGPQLHTPQTNEPQIKKTERTGDVLEEVPEEELAPAAVQLDLSKASPLIQELYAATRETKEQAILARLAKAKELVENGADLKATHLQGRTALHWAVFGSSYNTKPKIVEPSR